MAVEPDAARDNSPGADAGEAKDCFTAPGRETSGETADVPLLENSGGTVVVARRDTAVVAPDSANEPVPLLENSGGTDNPLEAYAEEILERSDDGKLRSAGWRIEIQRKPNGRLYWRWCKGGRKNRVREYPTVGGTFAILESLYPERAAQYKPRHKEAPRELGANHREYGD